MHVFLENFQSITWQMVVMWAIGALLIYLAIKKDMEPTLLLPMGFGAILINLPLPSVAEAAEITGVAAVLETLYNAGIRNELFPLLLVHRHWRDDRLRAAAFQPEDAACSARRRSLAFSSRFRHGVGCWALTLRDAASIAHHRRGGRPHVDRGCRTILGTKYLGAIVVAAYSYMALVPIVQPPCIPPDHHQSRTPHPHEVQSQVQYQQDHAHPVPDTW